MLSLVQAAASDQAREASVDSSLAMWVAVLGVDVAHVGRPLDVASGARLVKAGDPCESLWLVRSGDLLVRHHCPTTSELLPISQVGPGYLYGTHSLYGSATHKYFVHALAEASVWELPAADVLPLLDAVARRLIPYLAYPAVQHFSRALFEQGIQRAALAMLLSAAQLQSFPQHATLPAVGGNAGQVALVVAGRVRTANGVRVSGDLLGLESWMLGLPAYTDAKPLTELTLLSWPAAKLAEIAERLPVFRRIFAELVAARCGDRKPLPQCEPTDLNWEGTAEGDDEGALVELEPSSRRPAFWQRLPTFLQRDEMDCGAACLRMVIRYYGREVEYARLRSLAKVSRYGTSLADLSDAAESLGFEARGLQVNYESLRALDLPVVCHFSSRNHFVVLWDVRRKHVIVGDPAVGRRRMSRAEFELDWQGILLALTPTERLLDGLPTRVPSERRQSFRRLYAFVAAHKSALLSVLLASSLIHVVGLSLPLITQALVDLVVRGTRDNIMILLLASLVIAMLVSGALDLCRSYLVARAAARIERSLLDSLYARVIYGVAGLFQRFTSSDLMARFVEVGEIKNFAAENAIGVLVDAASMVVFFSALCWYDTRIVGIFMVSSLLLAAVAALQTRAVRRHMQEYRRSFDRYYAHLMDAFRNATSVKMLGLERQFVGWMRHLMTPTVQASFRASVASGAATATVNTGQALLMVLVMAMSLRQVLDDGMSLGEYFAVSMLARQASTPLFRLVAQWSELQRTLISGERIASLLEEEGEPRGSWAKPIELPPIRGHIVFSGVSFRYSQDPKDAARNILDHLDLEVHPGEIVGIVGRTGCGKSTFVNLLLAAYEPQEGSIWIDGMNLRDLNRQSLRQQIGYVSQESSIISGTLFENVACGRDVSMADVLKAVETSGAYRFISELPYGFATVVGERGVQLSGGQKQRLLIARGLVSNPRMLILDEATSALDPGTEQRVYSKLRSMRGECTTFVITHRIAALRKVDRLLVFEQGRLVEQGAHDELMSKRGTYYALATATPEWGSRG